MALFIMISESRARLYCREDISKIENYQTAVADNRQKWEIHHRLEASYSRSTLIRLGKYYGVPANELVFVTRAEHNRLHRHAKGMRHSEGTKTRMSRDRKNWLWWTDGTVCVRALECPAGFTRGRPRRSAQANEKTSASLKGLRWWNDGEVEAKAVECPAGFAPGRLKRRRHN